MEREQLCVAEVALAVRHRAVPIDRSSEGSAASSDILVEWKQFFH